MAMDVIERARKYVGCMDGAVSGSGGHDATFKAACALVHGFELSEADALAVMVDTFNPLCSPPWSEKDLRHKVRSALQAGSGGKGSGYLLGNSGRSARGDYGGRTAENAARRAEAVSKRQDADRKAMALYLKGGGLEAMVDVMERSPVDVQRVDGAGAFLDLLFDPGELVLVFTREWSQGDFGWECGGEAGGRAFRLGERAGVKAERVDGLPVSGQYGVWFLAQPVTGKWVPSGARDKEGRPKLSRRCGKCVKEYRYMLLEADEMPAADWLKIVSQLPLPVAAIYTSGGRSVHVLLRVDAGSYAQFTAISQKLGPMVAKLGGDSASISSVRLTRLPFCMREGTRDKAGKFLRYDAPRKQRLLYVNPHPEVKPLAVMPVLRKYRERGEGDV